MIGKKLATVIAMIVVLTMVMAGWLTFTGSQPPAFAAEMTRVIVSEEAAKQFDLKVGVLFEEAKAYNQEQSKNVSLAFTQEEITAKMASLGKVSIGPVPMRDVQVNLIGDKIMLIGYIEVPFSAVQVGAVAEMDTSGKEPQVLVDEISFGSFPLPPFVRDYFKDYILTANLAGSGGPVQLQNARIENNQLVLGVNKR